MSNKEFLKIKNLPQLEAKIEKDMKEVFYREKTAQDITKEVVRGIREDSNFPPAEATKKIRKEMEKLNKTHPSYQRSNINFTFTGELLNELWRNVKRFKTNRSVYFSIKHSTKLHRAYKRKGAKRKTSGKGVKQLSYLNIYKRLGELNKRYKYLKRKPSKQTRKNIVKILKKNLVKYYLKKNR